MDNNVHGDVHIHNTFIQTQNGDINGISIDQKKIITQNGNIQKSKGGDSPKRKYSFIKKLVIVIIAGIIAGIFPIINTCISKTETPPEPPAPIPAQSSIESENVKIFTPKIPGDFSAGSAFDKKVRIELDGINYNDQVSGRIMADGIIYSFTLDVHSSPIKTYTYSVDIIETGNDYAVFRITRRQP